MSLVFRTPDKAVQFAVEQLKNDGIVHPDAAYNPHAPGNLRREITYYDRDFMGRLGRTPAEAEVVDAALGMLRTHNLVDEAAAYDAMAFDRYRVEVKTIFSGSWTSLSPTMERLMYMLTSVKRPRHLLELGSFWGYTLAWFAGPCVGTDRVYAAERVIGIDTDRMMTGKAKENFARLPHSDAVELMIGDARSILPDLPGPFDFVYLEAKNDNALEPEGLYLQLLTELYDKLVPGAWVIAHDSLDWSFASEMAEYLRFVRNSGRFTESISFEIDQYGLELSVK